MDPNSTADLQVPTVGQTIRHGDVDYTVQGVMVRAARHVDRLEAVRHTLKFQIVASTGPPKAEDDEYNDHAYDFRL